MPSLADALAVLTEEDLTFADLLADLYAARYTGAVILHLAAGVPRAVDFPSRQIRLHRVRLDRRLDTRAPIVDTPR